MNGKDIPSQASELHNKARQSGASGNYNEAIEYLSQAEALAPDWPYPSYDMAFTYMLMKDYEQALRCYQKTIHLSPRGFFTALTAIDTLNREAQGEFPQGTYFSYLTLEWVTDPDEKAKMVKSMVEHLPTFAPGWKEYALQSEEVSDKLAAIEKGLAANPDVETKGLLCINKAVIINSQGYPDEAREMLNNLISDPNTSFSKESLAKEVLEMLTSI